MRVSMKILVAFGLAAISAASAFAQLAPLFDGPSDGASIVSMKNWHINAVRLPLNEACWNGDSYVEARYAGINYQHAIEAYVKLLNSEGMVVILDLHLSDGRYVGPSSVPVMGGPLWKAHARYPCDQVLEVDSRCIQKQ